MAGVRKEPRGGKYQGFYTDRYKRTRFFTGTNKIGQTRKIAEDLEARENQIRLGYLKAPEGSVEAASKAFDEVMGEYLAWGNAHGGRRGRPWGKTHAKERRSKLLWWKTELKLSSMGNLEGILPKAEAALRKLQHGGALGSGKDLSGRTLNHYAETLHSFCNWAVKRSYLQTNPVSELGRYNDSPLNARRALTPEEICRIMAVAPPHRRILYETALLSGLRAGELRALTARCIDSAQGILILDAAWTKNRKAGHQPIPVDLAKRLVEYGESRAAEKLYSTHYDRLDARAKDIPENPLLFVSTHPSRELEIDLNAAGIPKEIPGEGKVDFHSLRVTFITSIVENGADIKEAQELARHCNPNLTMNVYAKARKENLAALVEKYASTFSIKRDIVKCLSSEDEEGDGDDAIPLSDKDLSDIEEWWRRRDSNPRPFTGTRRATTCLVRLVFLALRLAADVRLRASFH